MRRPALVVPSLLVATSSVACPGVDGVPPDASPVETWVLPANPNRDLDVLFVIDNSRSMAGEQANLAANVPTLVAALQTIEGGLPNLHLGIVSTNVGAAGQANVPGCAGQGDAGSLLVKLGCTGLTGQFLSDVADDAGGRIKNYTGDLDARFSCMAELGTGGCPFPMPLEAAYRALQPGKNPGFYRAGAQLAVIIVSDKDDCSTEMGSMFGDPTAGLSSPLGPRTSFRCFEFGVICDDDPSPRAFGTKTGCKPRPDSQYMFELDRYLAFFAGLKDDPSQVMVAGIVGVDDGAHTAVVGPDPETPSNPKVERSCIVSDPADPNDGAVPPIRIGAFLRSFGDRMSQTSICRATLQDSLQSVGDLLKRAVRDPCVHRALRDRDAMTPGVQYDCTVRDVIDPRRPGRSESSIPACDAAGGTLPCWRITPNHVECPTAPDFLALAIDRGGSQPPSDSAVEAECVIE